MIAGCVDDRLPGGGIWFGWLGLVGGGGTNWFGVFWCGLLSLINAFNFSWYPLSLGDGFIFGVKLGFSMRLALAGFAGGLGGGNDLFLIRSDLRIFTMANSFSMGGGKCRGWSGGGGDGVDKVDCTFCFFFCFFFFGLGDVSAFLFCVRVGADGSEFFGVGGRKCCVIFVF